MSRAEFHKHSAPSGADNACLESSPRTFEVFFCKARQGAVFILGRGEPTLKP